MKQVVFVACGGGSATDGGGVCDALASLVDGETKDVKAVDPACCATITKTVTAIESISQLRGGTLQTCRRRC